jgi:hypothetical protein
MKKHLLHLVFLTVSTMMYGQGEVTIQHGCNFASDKTNGTFTMFPPTSEAEKIVDEILNTVLQTERPFTLQVADVPNAQATEHKDVRYLLYSKVFMDEFKKDPKAKWAAYFVFAHEIGHHVNLHNFKETDPKERRKMELSADAFAARVLHKLGASCEESLASLRAMKEIMVKNVSVNYPTYSAREEMVSLNCDGGGTESRIKVHHDSYNQWSLVEPGKIAANKSENSIVIDIELPQHLVGKPVLVQLCTTDPSVRIQSTKGVGPNKVGDDKKIRIIWNYTADQVKEAMATRNDLLKVFVYAFHDRPTAVISPQIKPKLGIIAGAGVAGLGVGAFLFMKARKDHNDIYLPNTEFDAPIFIENGATDRKNFYEKTQKKYQTGQMLIIGGGILAGTAVTWAMKNKSKNKKAYPKAICQNPYLRFSEPTLVASPLGFGFSAQF